MNNPDFEKKLRSLMDLGAELLPKLSRVDLNLSFEYHRFMSQAAEDEIQRRGKTNDAHR